ncbi:MAG TPA: choline ABC transporter permease subunit [Acidisoma sp.]|jgi:glycine betaine/proline transport system permease protein|uniref:choline ABC transporter permease subunit n=1 Tax=Acidisoma sp. TaxID=1872115 RepID=UPI002C1CB283|nr:choline ABC transporter permease subunit [Acidisoma sp.]HTI03633.1 choline ABC transporter permease subunit [Acidisoma sp.]
MLNGLADLVSGHKIPLGDWIASVVNAISGSDIIDAVSNGVAAAINGLTTVLEAIPAIILILAVGLLTYAIQRSWKLVLFVVLAQLFILNQGYWSATMETTSLIIFATVISMALGVPIGIACAHRPWLYTGVRPLLDLMQTLPTFVYLIPTVVLFGLGAVPGLISTIIFAVAAPIRLTQLGIASVPPPLIEAGEAFGASKSQLLWKVELPHALPTIMAGLTQCIMLSLSMVVIAALVGAGGLGVPVVSALNTLRVDVGFESGLCIVVLAVILDRVCRPRDSEG